MSETITDRTSGAAPAVRSYENDGQCVIEAAGEVTLETQDILAPLLRSTLENTTLPLVVDLRRVDYMDSSGLYVLVAASKRLRCPAVPLAPRVVVTPRKQPERVLCAADSREFSRSAMDLMWSEQGRLNEGCGLTHGLITRHSMFSLKSITSEHFR